MKYMNQQEKDMAKQRKKLEKLFGKELIERCEEKPELYSIWGLADSSARQLDKLLKDLIWFVKYSDQYNPTSFYGCTEYYAIKFIQQEREKVGWDLSVEDFKKHILMKLQNGDIKGITRTIPMPELMAKIYEEGGICSNVYLSMWNKADMTHKEIKAALNGESRPSGHDLSALHRLQYFYEKFKPASIEDFKKIVLEDIQEIILDFETYHDGVFIPLDIRYPRSQKELEKLKTFNNQ